jgi:NADH-quinone oxidoreductase subunit A
VGEITEFGKAFVYFIAGIVFILGGLLVSRLLAPHRPNPEKNSTYECGEETVGSAWVSLNMRFYLLGLVFLIFEVEVLLLFPWAISLSVSNNPEWLLYAGGTGGFFLAVLSLGLVYNWHRKDLDWVKTETQIPDKEAINTISLYQNFNLQQAQFQPLAFSVPIQPEAPLPASKPARISRVEEQKSKPADPDRGV